MSNFVKATCPCGTSFDREVKRGRPQVWCPVCLAIPFYERTSAPVAPVAATVVAVDEVTGEKVWPLGKNDRYREVRAEIEAAVVQIYINSLSVYHANVAGGMNPVEAGEARAKSDFIAITEVYAPHRKKFTSDPVDTD